LGIYLILPYSFTAITDCNWFLIPLIFNTYG
jgi:hypothetical protein